MYQDILAHVRNLVRTVKLFELHKSQVCFSVTLKVQDDIKGKIRSIFVNQGPDSSSNQMKILNVYGYKCAYVI